MKMQEEIQALEKKTIADSSNFTFDTKAQNELGEKLIAYADKFPEDKKAQEYLFKAASLYIGMGQSEKALNTLRKYVKTYPGGEFTARAAFNIGYVYDTQLHDTKKAKEAYQDFINKYPDDSLARDTRMMIQLLDNNVSDEALADSFLKKATEDSAKAAKAVETAKVNKK